MLKGHVFSKQLFENQIFALFVNTFLGGVNGISDNYMNSMPVTYSGSNVTIGSGAACIQGRFVEENTSTTIAAGTDAMYCKLVIEIDLDKTNTESDFQQGTYKIVKSASGYPNLTQTNIVKNNAGVYQYELARFKTTSSGITDFQDMRTFLDFDSIYAEVRQHIEDIDSGSLYFEKANFVTIEGTMNIGSSSGETKNINYPTGFSKANSAVIATGIVTTGDGNAKGYNYYGIYNGASDALNNAFKRRVNLTNDGITLYVENPSSSDKSIDYKIVIMKIDNAT